MTRTSFAETEIDGAMRRAIKVGNDELHDARNAEPTKPELLCPKFRSRRASPGTPGDGWGEGLGP